MAPKDDSKMNETYDRRMDDKEMNATRRKYTVLASGSTPLTAVVLLQYCIIK